MKLTTVLLMSAIMHVSAATYAQKVTLQKNNASLQSIFLEIRTQTGYDFLGDANLIRQAKPINIHVKDAPLNEVLEQCFLGQDLTYTIEEKTVVVKKKGFNFSDKINVLISLPPITITGMVTNTKGEALVGVSIFIKGTTKGTITDIDGKYKLEIPSDEITLTFSCVGMITKQVDITGKTLVNVEMEENTVELEGVEIINTGYQKISKERVAGSYYKPNMDVIHDRSGSMNVLQRLDGLIPGLTVNNSPGASANPLLIRGLSTIGQTGFGLYNGTNRNPLYVVNGIQMNDVSNINPQDIDDITVLKDAIAASTWGTRAANGVIVLTTKKGKVNGRINVTYNGFIDFLRKPDFNYLPGLNSQQFIQTAREIFSPTNYLYKTVSTYTKGGSSGIPPHEKFLYDIYRRPGNAAAANASLDSLASINNMEQIKDLWYRNAALMNHTISLSGGNNIYSVYSSLAYTDALSNRPGEKNNNYKIHLRQDFNVNKNIQLYLVTDLTNNVTSSQRNINISNRFLPYQLFRDASGNNLSMPYLQSFSDSTRISLQQKSGINLDYKPLDEMNYGSTKGNTLSAQAIAGITVKLLPGLRFEGVYGYIKSNLKTINYDDAQSYGVRSELLGFTTVGPIYYLPTVGGTYAISNQNAANWTVRNQLVYDNTFKNKHQINILVGQEAQEQQTTMNGSKVRGYNQLLQTFVPVDYATLGKPNSFPNALLGGFISTLYNDPFSTTDFITRITSYYSNMAYTYDRKYSINGSWRADKSNLFGLDKSAQGKPVWSAGLKWLIRSEKFMNNLTWLDYLAIRLTYGVTGNAPNPGISSSYNILAPVTSPFFPVGVTGLNISSPSNAKLSWESTKSINIGFDFSAFHNILSGSIDLYSKITTNLIGPLTTDVFSGYSSVTGNIGGLDNKGIELSLKSINIQKKNFSWNTMFVMSYNKNKITSLNLVSSLGSAIQPGSIPEGAGNIIAQQYRQGYPAFAVFGYRFAGLDNKGDPKIKLEDGTITKTLNVAQVKDVVYLGTTQPKWNGGLSNTLRYKRVSLSANIVYSLGNVLRRPVNTMFTGRLVLTNISAEFLDRWKKSGDEATTNIPSYEPNQALSASRRDVSYYTMSDINVVSASFIKMRDIALSYRLPENINRKLHTNDVSFRVQMSNIMLWKANKYGIDPEFLGNLPQSQNTFTLGLHVAF